MRFPRRPVLLIMHIYLSFNLVLVGYISMKSVEFLVDEFPDGRLMLLIVFREGKNFRIHRKNGETYYTWCGHDADFKMAVKIYQAVDRFNRDLRKKQDRRQDLKKISDQKSFYT